MAPLNVVFDAANHVVTINVQGGVTPGTGCTLFDEGRMGTPSHHLSRHCHDGEGTRVRIAGDGNVSSQTPACGWRCAVRRIRSRAGRRPKRSRCQRRSAWSIHQCCLRAAGGRQDSWAKSARRRTSGTPGRSSARRAAVIVKSLGVMSKSKGRPVIVLPRARKSKRAVIRAKGRTAVGSPMPSPPYLTGSAACCHWVSVKGAPRAMDSVERMAAVQAATSVAAKSNGVARRRWSTLQASRQLRSKVYWIWQSGTFWRMV